MDHAQEMRTMSTIGQIPATRRARRLGPVILTMIALILVAGCAAAGGGTVKVTLSEWAVQRDKAELPAGSITFEVTNTGPADIHEFVVVKTDLAPGELPTDSTGKVDEEGGGMTVEGEIEDIAVGASDTLTLNLTAGKYALICNIYSEEEDEAHYHEGMRTDFTVN
jgi:uncharacterized cupredoxin-like copper-binding protein